MKLTDSEWRIMTLLWQRHPVTAREIADGLPAEVKWAYTTIKTLLSRLVEKQAVSEQKRGNISLYSPIVSRNQARKEEVVSLIAKAFGGAVEPMIDFLAEERGMSEDKRKQLLDLLDDLDRRGGDK
jgi:BlaI family penicillinase repressor